MSNHIKADELSAYLDGEASDAATLESHVEACASCRSELASIRSVSHRMQALSESEVHPAFAQRVLATISEQETTRGRSVVLRWVYALTPVAVAALLFLTVSLNTTVDAPVSTTSGSTEIALVLEQGEDVLFEELSMHLAQTGTQGSIVSEAYQIAAPEPIVPDTALLAFALSDSKNRAHVDQQWPDTKDVRTTINHLNAEESNLFKQMLVVHAQEAFLGEASFEG